VIVLNGEPWERGAQEPVASVLELLGLGVEARGVAVAVDGEVVPRAGWSTFRIPEGARVEVLTAMQGG
jgi:sulfur carrier protein